MIKQSDCQVGTYYYGEHIGRNYIYKYNENNTTYRELKISNSSGDNGNFKSCTIDNIRLATPQEIKWLDECRKANKYIPISEIQVDEVVNNYLIF